MKIDLGVEALSSQLTGIGRYTLELFRGLKLCADVKHLRGYIGEIHIEDPEALLESSFRMPSRKALRAQKIKRRMERYFGGSRLFHGPNFMLPDRVEQGIITVHDLSVFKYPEAHPAERIEHFESAFQRSVERASHIITDTEYGRKEFLEFTGMREDRVTAIHLGVSSAYCPERAGDGSIDYGSYGIERGKYILVVATIEPRKRIETALLAYKALPEAYKARFPLVIAGASGWKNDLLHDMMQSEEAKGRIRFLGFVTEDHLPALFAGATLFLFPSVYEGFGLPPIEAMASGVPTIASNRSCLPEVTAGAAMLIDPDDIEGWAQGIMVGVDDETWRVDAITRGFQVVSNYRWEHTVRKTVETYYNAWNLA